MTRLETYLTTHSDDGSRRSDRDRFVRWLQGIQCLIVAHRLHCRLSRLLHPNDKQCSVRRARE